MTHSTFTLDFAYDTETFAESFYAFRKIYEYAVINPTGELENGWPEIEVIVPSDRAMEFLIGYCGGDEDQARDIFEGN
jgi:hypothetical protein